MSAEGLEAFKRRVFDDAELQLRLRGFTDRDYFITEVEKLGILCGNEITRDDIAAAMNEGRRSWLERWIR